MSPMPSFGEFFSALWDYEPFPWQDSLAHRIQDGRWPEILDLPTAAGKTACIDAAIFALASQADRPVGERTAPRRIWFVVDRRIVVDEAHDRAEKIAHRLRTSNHGPLKAIAERLLQIGGTERPLAVARLRGGILRDDGWGRIPSQPAVITSTVDQVGSRLLFRGYGYGQLSAPIFAGLAANDSLIILDEAHCSVPFFQTLRAIEGYRAPAWAEVPLRNPFAFAVLSATPPADTPAGSVFPGDEREAALAHPTLDARLNASKPVERKLLKSERGKAVDPLVEAAAQQALEYVRQGRARVAVIVNRVRTAGDIAGLLQGNGRAEVVLLTGRLRPYERDRVVANWKPYLRANSPQPPSKPVILVSTQCIEVGADFSFDAMITECASLDALRQRFGRLNRMGLPGLSPASILIRTEDTEPDRPDPVYGEAMARTWELLGHYEELDFGFNVLDATLADVEDLTPCLAPRPDAPILLPAHLDLLCQTAPKPVPEPEISLYLHGKERGAPEVRVLWRADLLEDETSTWRETMALCPPSSGETLAVPLYQLRRWLAQQPGGVDQGEDLEGIPAPEPTMVSKGRPCLLWRGRERSQVCREPEEILPNETVVLPATYGYEGVGQVSVFEALGAAQLDLWEPARVPTGMPVGLRLQRDVLAPWSACQPLQDLLEVAEDPAWERERLQEAISHLLAYQPADEEVMPPSWWLEILGKVRLSGAEQHPSGGLILFGRPGKVFETDLYADDDDLTSAADGEVSLSRHTESVEAAVAKMATRCLSDDYLEPLLGAVRWHDAGKLDRRFQVLLRQGDELAALSGEPLAKSRSIPSSPARRRGIRESCGLPGNFRHEMLSLQLASRSGTFPNEWRDLVLHLIASHHGHGRPFAPVCIDSKAPEVSGTIGDLSIELKSETREGLTPTHRADSGVSERFWRLTRRYGWWGLAYLEAIVRLGDWYGSQNVIAESRRQEYASV
ncbi:type I-U CRISPR-associated helicase/endonuclease Cas3 [bacterium CPR1]|nr:type I-U CRISPR-associated helicase/endonuclease Cas3 [bacterium CPR1]